MSASHAPQVTRRFDEAIVAASIILHVAGKAYAAFLSSTLSRIVMLTVAVLTAQSQFVTAYV